MIETRFAIGDLVENRYRVRMVIGPEKTGALYQVSDEARNAEVVALKTLRYGIAQTTVPDSIERFQREFLILTQLRHPNLVSVYDYGITTDGHLYYTMEWIEGKNLTSRLGSLAASATIPVMVQICRALGYLHAREVMHGDLKPANVLLCGEQVKIVDFGLAHDVSFESDQPHYVTPFYTAPEVSKGQAADGRADLYSLGAMMYEWIVGESPDFMVGAERLIRLSLRERLATQVAIPVGIASVVMRLLAQDAAERYSNANRVIDALNKATGSNYQLETRETASSYALRARFLGRGGELAQLRDIWEAARDQHAGLLLIGGESGVGKTRLVEELEVEVELSGARVVWGQCLESGGSAYQPWREVLRVLLRYVETVENLDLKRVGPVLGAIMPELWSRHYMAELAPPAELESQAARQRLNDAILQVLLAAAQTRPTLVVIEDAHWGDEASLEMLRYLGRALGNPGLLVCVTYRSDEVAKAVADADADAQAHVLVELSGEPVERILLETLPADETQQLVCSMLGLRKMPNELAERVQGITGGNTFFVQELIRSLAEDGQVLKRTVAGWHVDQTALHAAQLPGTIQQVVWRRLEQLSEQMQQVLSYAAVVGPVFWEGAIAQAGQVSKTRVRAALTEAMARELVVIRDETSFAGEREYLFTKPAMQQVSYEGLMQEHRQESHARVADWLIAHVDEQIGEHTGLIADHLQASQQTALAVNYLRQAGEQAAAQFANAQAISYFSRALELTPEDDQTARYELLLAREKMYDLQGARQSQAQDLALLMDLAMALDETATDAGPDSSHLFQVEVTLRQASYYEVTSDFPAAITVAQKAVRLARASKDVGRQAAGYQQWGVALRRLAEYDSARRQLEHALDLARAAGLRQVEADSLRGLGKISWRQALCAEAKIYHLQALRISRQLGDRRGESQALNDIGTASADQGDKEEGRAYFEQALDMFQEIGDRRAEGLARQNFALSCSDLGDYDQARVNFEQALITHREVGYRVGEARTLGNLGHLYRLLGDFETAQQTAQRALRIAKEIGAQRLQVYCLTNLGLSQVGLGDWAQAAHFFQQALTLGRRLFNEHHLTSEAQAGLAHVALAQGHIPQALVQVEQILTYLEPSMLNIAREPFRVYLTCYRVLEANQDPRAESILSTAHQLLEEQSARISDEGTRQMYLGNILVHREIITEYDQTKR